MAFQEGTACGPLLQPLITLVLNRNRAHAIKTVHTLTLQLLIEPLQLLLTLLELLLQTRHLLPKAL